MPTKVDAESLEYIFHPRSVAIIGIPSDPAQPIGSGLLDPFSELEFDGKLYPVNPKGGKWRSLKVYSSLKEIPGPVDYVIVAIPASATPKLMEDCVAKGVKAALFVAAGFSEVGTEEGRRLEEEIVEIARKGGVRIIGPNCFGIYCPKTKLSSGLGFPKECGNVGFISQSGGSYFYTVRAAASRGVRFSKAISYGNACDLNESDFLEYFAQDPDTEVIAAYIEGVKEGRRFLKALEEAAKMKPVIIHKGGYTEAGIKTAASHTGALAGENVVWDAIFKQTGVIRVYSVDELIDVILLFVFMSPPGGRNVGVAGSGGGASVQVADECGKAGLHVPKPPPEVLEKLREFTPEAGSILGNPLDSQLSFWDPTKFGDSVKIFAKWKGIDLMILHLGMFSGPSPQTHMASMEARREAYVSSAKECDKPVAVVLHSVVSFPESVEIVGKWQRSCSEVRLPFYPSTGRATNAINKFIKYHEDRSEGK
ncbi:acetate--CoA ligase family protein [Chloroflexota bacterium]